MPDEPLRPAAPPVPMLDFGRDFAPLRTEILEAITAVCDSQRFVLGPAVESFERAAALACGVPFAAGCASGTDALWLALAALGIGPGDAVITTPFSFFATVSAILRTGATPLLADIDGRTFNLSPDAVRKLVDEAGQQGSTKIKAVMPVHLYGQCADMEAFQQIGAEHGLKLVEDAAQAFGAAWSGVRAGGLGDTAAFSFYPTKNLSAFGDAGMVTTRDAATDDRVRILRAHGMRQRYFHEEIGWNSRLDSLQAAVLQVKLKHVEAGNVRRRALAGLYDLRFRAVGLAGATTADGVVLPFTDPRAEPVFHQYVIRSPRRDALREFLASQGIGSEVYYPLSLHMQKSLSFMGYRRGDFPVSEQAAEEVLALPIYPGLRDEEVERVVDAVRRFFT